MAGQIKGTVEFQPPQGGEPVTVQFLATSWDGDISNLGTAVGLGLDKHIAKIFPELGEVRKRNAELEKEIEALKAKSKKGAGATKTAEGK